MTPPPPPRMFRTREQCEKQQQQTGGMGKTSSGAPALIHTHRSSVPYNKTSIKANVHRVRICTAEHNKKQRICVCLAFVPAPDPEISAAATATAALDDSCTEDGSSLNNAIFVWNSNRQALSSSDSTGLNFELNLNSKYRVTLLSGRKRRVHKARICGAT